MKHIFTLLLIGLITTGCASKLVIIDQTLLSEDRATLIVIPGKNLIRDFSIMVDDMQIGRIPIGEYLKVNIVPGNHTLHVERVALSRYIRRETTHVFEKGKVYYMQTRFETGLWVNSMWIEPIAEISSYEARIY